MRTGLILATALSFLVIGCGGPTEGDAPADTDSSGQGPLPEAALWAEWTQRTEGVFEAVLELRSLAGTENGALAENDERVLALWEQIADTLPPEDLLRQRMARVAAGHFRGRGDALKEAQIAEHSNSPGWAASVYRALGMSDDADRMQLLAKEYGRRRNELREWHSERSLAGEDLHSHLATLSVGQQVEFLTTGIDEASCRGAYEGFSYFVATLPDNVRLRRAMTLYYAGGRACGNSSPDGDIDVTEPMLRLTAVAFPSRLGRIYQLIVASGQGQVMWYTGPAKIPGDFCPVGNALVLTRDILRIAPQATPDMLAAARLKVREASSPAYRCRWLALVAYLEDGAPDPGDQPKEMLIAKLAGSPEQRRWALAWIPNQLVEAAPNPYPFVTDLELSDAIVTAAGMCQSDDDLILALDALRIVPPLAGIDAICQAAGSEQQEVQAAAITAILKHFSRAQPMRWDADRGRAAPVADGEFARELPALREAFYPYLSDRAGRYLIEMFAQLGDSEIDAAAASHISAEGFTNHTFLRSAASMANSYKELGWDSTISAIEERANDPDYERAEHAAYLTKHLRAGTW